MNKAKIKLFELKDSNTNYFPHTANANTMP